MQIRNDERSADFRLMFGQLDETALITAGELASLLPALRETGNWRAALMRRMRAGTLPAPVIKEVRGGHMWRASDVRAWLASLQQQAEPLATMAARTSGLRENPTASGKRRGRPRKSDVASVQAAPV